MEHEITVAAWRPSKYRLHDLIVDVERREVLRDRTRIPLSELSFDLLAALIRAAPNLLTYDELIRSVWPGLVVSPETVTKRVELVRDALGDDPRAPRYIAGVRGRGYRVTLATPLHALTASPVPVDGCAAVEDMPGSGARRRLVQRSILAALVIVPLVVVAGVWLLTPSDPRITKYTQLTYTRDTFSPYCSPIALSTDGRTIYFNEWVYANQHEARRIPVAGGEALATRPPIGADEVGEITAVAPNLREIVIGRYPKTLFQEGSAWLWVPDAKEMRRLGTVEGLVHGWSGDGERLVASWGPDLFVADRDGNNPKKVFTAHGKIYWPRFSADGKRIRFSVRGYSLFLSLWEVSIDGTNPHQLLVGWNDPSNECCGSWTPDGKFYVFEATRNGVAHVWIMRDDRELAGTPAPIQLTSGPMNMMRPTISPDGRLFAIGLHPRADVMRYDSASGVFVTDVLKGRSAEWISYSADGEWMSYVSFPDAVLWRSRRDGTQALQLTKPPMRAIASVWSPDGQTLAFEAQTPETDNRIYLVGTDGMSEPRRLTRENRAESGMTWSPDGKSIVFQPIGESLRIVDVASGHSQSFEGGEGMYNASWSRDGRLAAMVRRDRSLVMLFDFSKREWNELPRVPHAWYSRWSSDARYLYVMTEYQSVYRIDMADHSRELVATAEHERFTLGIGNAWVGVTPEGDLLYLHDDSVQRIYALDWNL